MAFPTATDSPWSRRGLGYAAFLAIGYYFLAWFGISLPGKSGFSSYIWPAAGFAVACILRAPPRHWALLATTIYMVGVVNGIRAGYPLIENLLNAVSPIMALGNAGALYLAFKGRPELDTMNRVAAFSAIIVVVTGAVSALGGAYAFGMMGKEFLHEWRTWFISDCLGILLITPLVLAWTRPDRESLADRVGKRKLEVLLLYVGLVVSTLFIYTAPPDPYGGTQPPTYLCIPFLVWAALRFGLRGTTLGLALFAFISLWFTARGVGPYAAIHVSAEEAALQLQAYLSAVGVMVLFVSALMFERQRAQRENESWRRRYEAAIEASGNLVFDIDPVRGTIVWAGDTQKVLGIPERSICTVRDWTARVVDSDRPGLLGLRARLASGELHTVPLEYSIRRDDGGIITLGINAYSIEAADAGLAGSRHIIGFVKDITRKLRDEAERRDLEDRLKQAQKMEAIGRLAGGIAHDFNNILGAILGYGEMARGKVPAGSDVRRHLDTIVAAGERGKALVAQILTFSRARPAEKQLVLVHALIDEVAALLQGSLPERIKLVVNITDHDLTVMGEVTQLHQLVMNLATNALQAMTGPGRLGITVQELEVQHPHPVSVGTLHSGRYAVITVRDTGPGMDEATLARIFEPFFTTKPVGKGTGLGLPLAQSIALGHDGAMDIRSVTDAEGDHGTTFTVYLPAQTSTAPHVAVDTGELPRGQGETILVVDDEEALVRLLEDQLADLGYEPVGFTSSEAAWAAIETAPRRFDAIISDEVMPGLTGTELTARLRASGGRLPVLLVSGYGGPGFEIRAQAAGATRLLKKPCSKNELADALAAALEPLRLSQGQQIEL